jgi:hypothetical protein
VQLPEQGTLILELSRCGALGILLYRVVLRLLAPRAEMIGNDWPSRLQPRLQSQSMSNPSTLLAESLAPRMALAPILGARSLKVASVGPSAAPALGALLVLCLCSACALVSSCELL